MVLQTQPRWAQKFFHFQLGIISIWWQGHYCFCKLFWPTLEQRGLDNCLTETAAERVHLKDSCVNFGLLTFSRNSWIVEYFHRLSVYQTAMFKLLSQRHGDILLLKCQVDLKHEKVQVNQLLAEWFLLTTLIISDAPNLLDPPAPPPPPRGGHVLDHEGSEVKDNASFDHSPRAPNVSERIQDMAFILVPHTHTHYALLIARDQE